MPYIDKCTHPGTIPVASQSVTYTPFNMTASLSNGSYTLGYTYGPDNQRIKSVLANGPNPVKTKYYSYNYEKEIRPSGTREINYINSPYGLVAVVVKENNIYTPYYIETDHLGSIIGLLNNDGTYAERYSFDAWGRRRNPSDWSYENIPAPTILDRGYTGHEHLDVFGLINMNGRMYDPVLGRFLGADPVLQDQGNSQSYNGYSYCLNNPLKYSDPSGYSAYRDPWTDPTHLTLEQMWQEKFDGQYGDFIIGVQGRNWGYKPQNDNNKKGNKSSTKVKVNIKITVGAQAGSNFGGFGGTYGLFGNLCSITLIGYENGKFIYPSSQKGYSQINQGIDGGFGVGGEVNHTFDGSIERGGYKNDNYNFQFGLEKSVFSSNIDVGTEGKSWNIIEVDYKIGVILGLELSITIRMPLK